MRRTALAVVVVVLLVATVASAQNCDLTGGFFLPHCTGPVSPGQTSHCTISLTNTGPAACNGTWIGAFGAIDPGTASNGNSTFGGCSLVASYPFPTPQGGVAGIAPAMVCQAVGTLVPGATFTMTADITPGLTATGFEYKGGYVGSFQSSATVGTTSAAGYGELPIQLVSCTAIPSAPGVTFSDVLYFVSWNGTGTGSSQYEIQEALTPDFSNPTSSTVPTISQPFSHTVSTPTRFYYRVRPVTCGGQPGSFGPIAQTVVIPPQDPTSRDFDAAVPVGSTSPITQPVTFSGLPAGAPFTASTDQPFLAVAPASGHVAGDGTVTVTVTATPTSSMPAGANTGTVSLTLGSGKWAVVPNDTRSTSTTISISLVTPVNPTPKNAPPADAVIVPAVAHLQGGAALFRSDVRITNASTSPQSYLLSFTPSGVDGTTTGKQTTISINGGDTAALNDILKDFFGFALPSDTAGGALEIRGAGGPMTQTFVSSRTYAATNSGTYGQFVPALPVAGFLKSGAGSLTLTQISEAAAFHTNIGLVEGLGSPVSGHFNIFDPSGQSLGGPFPFTLSPFEFSQLGHFLAGHNITAPDARIEAVVDSGSGSITTYASVLDNVTQDPLLVSPVQRANLSANRYVLPGVAYIPTGTNFHSDVRIFNGSNLPVNATATFYPQTPAGPAVIPGTPVNISIGPGEIKVYNDVLPTLFGISANTGGSIVVTTPANSTLIVSGRTYSNAPGGGTYGQFIPAVTPADGIGLGDSPLQILQLEQSANFRSNVGVAELTGNPVTVQIAAVIPGSKVSPSTTISLRANEFLQKGQILATLNPGNTYDGRIIVTVVGGTGRVTAYASVIDNQTQDPTYVPAQK